MTTQNEPERKDNLSPEERDKRWRFFLEERNRAHDLLNKAEGDKGKYLFALSTALLGILGHLIVEDKWTSLPCADFFTKATLIFVVISFFVSMIGIFLNAHVLQKVEEYFARQAKRVSNGHDPESRPADLGAAKVQRIVSIISAVAFLLALLLFSIPIFLKEEGMSGPNNQEESMTEKPTKRSAQQTIVEASETKPQSKAVTRSDKADRTDLGESRKLEAPGGMVKLGYAVQSDAGLPPTASTGSGGQTSTPQGEAVGGKSESGQGNSKP